MKRLFQAIVATSMAFLVACGGGGGGGGSASSPVGGGVPATNPTNPPPTTQGSVKGFIVVVYPATSSQARSASVYVRSGGRTQAVRHPMYIAPTTVTAVWSATPQGSSTVAYSGVADLSAGSSLCTSTGGGGRTCTIPIYVNPGTYTVTLQTYDQAPVNGQVPSSAKLLATSSITTTIAQDSTNSLTFVLSGIVGGVTATNGLGAATYFSTPGDGSSHQVGIGLTITDPDGNVITGSAPYASPIPVTLTEASGSGHMSLIIAGTNVGTSGSITKPSDTLAVQYDGKGSGAYHSTVTLGSGGTALNLTVSPMYLSVATLTYTKLVQSQNVGITETGAPASIAYAATPSSCPATSNGSTAGTGAASTATVAVNVPGGTNTTCSVVIADILGTSMTVPITYTTSGPITVGTVTGSNISGSCATILSFAGTGVVVTQNMTDPGFTGPLVASSTNTGVVTVSVTGLALTITSVGAGTATVNISDASGNTFACSTGVTSTGGTVSVLSVPRLDGAAS